MFNGPICQVWTTCIVKTRSQFCNLVSKLLQASQCKSTAGFLGFVRGFQWSGILLVFVTMVIEVKWKKGSKIASRCVKGYWSLVKMSWLRLKTAQSYWAMTSRKTFTIWTKWFSSLILTCTWLMDISVGLILHLFIQAQHISNKWKY